MEIKQIKVTVNGEPRIIEVEPRLLCVHMIREVLGMTGTHLGCDTTSCGACTVLLDGVPVKSCTLFGIQTDGHEITTVEGLGRPSELHPVQEGFKEEHGLQCGFCTPGMLLAALDFLNTNPRPTEAEMRQGLSSVLCRCTGYQGIVKAVEAAAVVLARSPRSG